MRVSWSMRRAATSASLSDELGRRAYSSTASASGSDGLLDASAPCSKEMGEAGLTRGELGDGSRGSCDACMDSCLEVKMRQGPSMREGDGKCSAGCA